MKAVKSSNKKRSRNITIGAVVGFLLSCTAVMGATSDNYLWIKGDSGKIKFSIDGTTGADGKWNEGNPYSNNNWDTGTKTYTNNTLLSSNGANGKEEKKKISYGLRLSGELTDVNFINNSSIKGEMSGVDYNYGYGIYNESTKMGNIENMGVISGYGTSSSGYGNGIENYKGTIGDITNTGVISGYCTSSSSYGYGNGYGIENDEGTIGDITNTGVISGYGNGLSSGSGYGITNYSLESLAQMGNITNAGLINGSGSGSSTGSGRGINNTHTMENITNTGIISGTGKLDSSGKSYGIYSVDKIGNIINTGIISGTSKHDGNYESCGIYNFGKMGNIENTGVIYGTDNAIKNNSRTIGTINNYGILVNGSNNDVISNDLTLSNDYGLIIKNEGKGTITAGTAGTQDITIEYDKDGKVIKSRSMTIKNANIEGGSGKGTSTESIELGSNNYDNHILNGKDETLKVTGENDKITGSIINAYGTAVVFEGENKQLTLSGTIVNGGIDNSAAISGSDNADNGDTLILQSGMIKYKDGSEVTQNTIVNGNIDMKNGSDKLTVGSGTIINGNIDMGAGDDELDIENGAVINGKLDGGIGTNSTLNFNSSTARTLNSDKINIVHSISNFKNMNINTNVTLFEKTIDTYGKETDLKVTGADEIKIGKNGTLTLRINSSKMGSGDEADKIIGHALYENTGEISSTDGGKLLLALNGAGNESIISFGSTTLGDGLVTGNGGTLDTTSALHTLERIDDKEVKVIVKQDIPDFFEIPEYEKLNKIYHGILSVEDLIANFNVDDESLSIFLGYLNDIYAGNPYSYSSELSRKSVGMFRDIAVESQFKPELNKWLIMGGLTHVDGGTKDTYYGKGYYTYDIGSSDMDADTKITGAYMLGEYGVSDTLTYGVLIGGNKLKSELSNGSKVDGDALYMGAYAKKYVGNLKVTGGLGLQYGDYDADRLAVNKVASSLAEPVMKYSDNYNDMTYDIYLNGRYSHNIGENLFLEPYGTLSYTYIKQDSADEGSKVLAIETDSKSFDYTAAKVGVDLKKVIPHEKGKSTLSAGVSYTRLLNGADEENITGRFKGGSDFDILVAHKNEH